MDEVDQSQRAEELFLAEALARRNASEPLGPVFLDGVACCRECGEPIPAARLAAVPGAALCVGCQSLKEVR
ncbi:TraR/DksA family transcriptional regulator [Desulfocurvibacter africanus]|uniref:Phage/conjugal plasmid C-4 type zinc finger protein, TraR family n=1 Tax=Desulfocurvibacter africanus subsp. africanus str. Walvis Bay TaxID=690850 RepID=F3YW04_DESAF|nr:TraR/DksA family transcriptional regulator [Desulfocurvibacter africanus]EGJ49034.1 phage/conjugal plasmid C-4 type zinc finger protein, TraR family [Desulfocurvibacter africanus subsp. africanus str. Walvis Bay]